ncbi:hypothetical protein MLD38_025701 [Melastoma candidum]|uniref:Uncharacterized protein n=1 Tax=Melastoma candidum TaxID=119954 RepID=A0ACB9NZ27_9MYRT|nr:hypothetical protein MLD38_025701 [Melastoma candidum]
MLITHQFCDLWHTISSQGFRDEIQSSADVDLPSPVVPEVYNQVYGGLVVVITVSKVFHSLARWKMEQGTSDRVHIFLLGKGWEEFRQIKDHRRSLVVVSQSFLAYASTEDTSYTERVLPE